jgi:hypothetical protein
MSDDETGLIGYKKTNLHRRDWGRALEELKPFNGLPPNWHHGRIMENGDVLDDFGNYIDNLGNYILQ